MPKSNAAAVPTPGNIPLECEELDRILCAHAAFLSNPHKGARAAVLSRDLTGADLSNRILCQADLSGSCLSGSNLKFANLLRANLYCCEMRNLDARYAKFHGADMRPLRLKTGEMLPCDLEGTAFTVEQRTEAIFE
jgi:uncharacterized protein YjbI with pentapeptide repeats